MGPQAETGPLGARRPKTRAAAVVNSIKQKLPAEISKQRRRSPALLRLVLDSLAEYPVKIYAASKAGIHCRTIDYWLKCSAAGSDGYDVEWRGETSTFHEHYQSTIKEGVGKLEVAAYEGGHTSILRIDLSNKIMAQPSYIQDMRLPGMVFKRVLGCSPREYRRRWRVGSQLESADDCSHANQLKPTATLSSELGEAPESGGSFTGRK